jgi:hypothetical protein
VDFNCIWCCFNATPLLITYIFGGSCSISVVLYNNVFLYLATLSLWSGMIMFYIFGGSYSTSVVLYDNVLYISDMARLLRLNKPRLLLRFVSDSSPKILFKSLVCVKLKIESCLFPFYRPTP